MKRLLAIFTLVILTVTTFTSCEKDVTFSDDIVLESFTFEPSSNEGLNKSVSATIEGKTIYIRVPNAVDIKAAVPTFRLNQAKNVAFIGSKVVESGVTPIDLSDTNNPTVIRFGAEGSVSEYSIIGVKNASILSFGFYAEDNEGVLFRDYTATITKLAINVDLPIDADVTSLVARYTTTDGATVKYNGAAFVSKQTAVDYTSAVEISLSDDEMESDEIFTVNVGRLTAPVWSEVVLPEFLNVSTTASTVEINPLTNQPYVMIQRSGSADLDRKAVMAGYNPESTSWFSVGDQTGFSDSRIDGVSFTFAKNGDIFAAYKDYLAGTNVQYGTVQKYTNGAWSYVGGIQSTFNRVNYLSIAVDNNDVPYLGYIFARAASPFPNRGTYVESFRNGAWSGGTMAPSTTGFWSKIVKGRDGVLYYLVMDLTSGTGVRKPSVYKLLNDNWSLVGQMNVGPSNSNSGNLNIDLDATEDGQLYLTYQSNNPSYATYVMHWDGNTWKQLGDGIAQTTSGSANRDNVAVKVHPDGRIFFAYSDANNGIKVTTFNNETGNWNPASLLSTSNGNKLEMRISEEGVVYLTTVIDSRVVLFKYDIPVL
ncbi:hypothetical protein [Sphingobacterium bovistauri]|uniref:Calx-beta domain-containing protein n=1 Tax=Sphingobacterium bovistauri TaxID=2781959 RepID=A0ABS7ZAL6_9SPHI|nr:hypothetical protein [Sphingobacterium bovistauri]MCA5006627.1 hypothetical protein [Sphingobacterium bovistauri]